MIDFSTYQLNRNEQIIFYLLILVGGVILSILLYRNVLLTVIIFPFVKRIREYIVSEIAKKRQRQYMVQFKDFLFVTSTAIGAGRSMKDAIKESIPELVDIYGKDSILAGELVKTYTRMHIGGENDVNVLMDLAIHSGIEDCVDFVTIYSICKTTGASMMLALNKAASVIIEKMTIEREISELVRRKEMEGMIIFIMPIAVILFLNIFAPEYIAPLYDTWIGKLIMTAVIVANIGIYGMIRKIVSVEI